MADIKLVEKWLKKADEDFGFASASLENELDFFAPICFHFHQAAEKYLKSYILRYDLDFRKIHDLLELLEICSKRRRKLRDLKESCAFLNRFYISTRYPVYWSSNFSRDDAIEALAAAETIAKTIKKLLKE